MKMTIKRMPYANLFESAVIEVNDVSELSTLRCAMDEYIAMLESFDRDSNVEEIYQRALSVRDALHNQ